MAKNLIYNLGDGKIDVYSFVPNKKKVVMLKKSELLTIPQDELLLDRDKVDHDSLKLGNIVLCAGNYVLKKVPPSHLREDKEHSAQLLVNYIKGEFDNNSIHIGRRYDKDENLYYIVPQSLDSRFIQLTNKLRLLNLLQNGKYSDSDLLGSSLKDISDVFDLSNDPIMSLSLNDLSLFFNSGLIDTSFMQTLKYVDNSTQIYKKIKRRD